MVENAALLAKIEDWRKRIASVDARVARIATNINTAKADGRWAAAEAAEAAGNPLPFQSTFLARKYMAEAEEQQQRIHAAAAAWFAAKNIDPATYDIEI